MFFLLLRNPPCRENSLSTTVGTAVHRTPGWTSPLAILRENITQMCLYVSPWSSRFLAMVLFVQTPLLPWELPRRAGSNHPLLPGCLIWVRRGPRGKAAGQGQRPCLPGALHSALQSPASPGCQSADCQWCQDRFHSQLLWWRHQHFNSNCLKALVVTRSNTSYKTMCSGELCWRQCESGRGVLPTPPGLPYGPNFSTDFSPSLKHLQG